MFKTKSNLAEKEEIYNNIYFKLNLSFIKFSNLTFCRCRPMTV